VAYSLWRPSRIKKADHALKQETIYTNVYISINGKSSLSRKSTVIKKTDEVLRRANPSIIDSRIPTEFSPEAFIEHMSRYPHACWVRDEAAGLLAAMEKNYMAGFKETLMQLYDCAPIHRLLRTKRSGGENDFRIDDPYLNMIWATTDAALAANTSMNDTLSGFLARFMFFFPQGSKESWLPYTEGSGAESMFEDVVVDQLRDIKAKLDSVPPTVMHVRPEALEFLHAWQYEREKYYEKLNDGSAQQIYSRHVPMTFKLAMLFELGYPDFDPARGIRLDTVKEVCRIVDEYMIPTARGVYEIVGKREEKNKIDKVVAVLKQNNGLIEKRRLQRAVHFTRKEMAEVMEALIENEEVEVRYERHPHGAPTKIWLVLRSEPFSTNNTFSTNVTFVTGHDIKESELYKNSYM